MDQTFKLLLIRKAQQCAEVAKPIALISAVTLAPHLAFKCEKFFAFQEARCQDVGEGLRYLAEMFLTSTSTATNTASNL
jgi:hypothetical protein